MTGTAFTGGDPAIPEALFGFLRDLDRNNDRGWFAAHKTRYEAEVKGPLMSFIGGFADRLASIAPHFVADPRPVGGSMFRIYRDVRFSKDKRPYKRNVGLQFRHERARDVHAPGYYLHLEPGKSFCGCGIWRPDATALAAIRSAIASHGDGWDDVVESRGFTERFRRGGDMLKRPPRGYKADHPMIDELRRKDHVASFELTDAEVTVPDFAARLESWYGAAGAYIRFLTEAVGLEF